MQQFDEASKEAGRNKRRRRLLQNDYSTSLFVQRQVYTWPHISR